MKLTIDSIRPGIYTMHLSLPYSHEELLKEFELETWQEHNDRKDSAGLAGDPYAERSGLLNPNGTALKSIMDFINSDVVKLQIINTIYKTQGDYISALWEGWDQQQLNQYTFWGCMYNRDKPGFHIPVHLDTRLQIATAMIYFTAEDDPNQSTVYYTDKNQSDPLRINNKFGNGVLHINDHTAWHEGFNKSNTTRYSLICGLLLRVKEQV